MDIKPRIKKAPDFLSPAEAWECIGAGKVSWGSTPEDAYCKWRLKVKPLMIEE